MVDLLKVFDEVKEDKDFDVEKDIKKMNSVKNKDWRSLMSDLRI